jgi:pimeloyl-ACP methyl ester carboxylesterase
MLPRKKKIAYRKTEKTFKNTIIHLHGSKGDSKNMAPIMKRLQDKAQIIAIDMRGFG